jgi:hypothetical protein
MGTSSARRAPTTWLWRRAKGAATRYLAPDGGFGLEAREVVARYLAALGEDTGPESQGLLASFRLTRKAGQNLGAFADTAASRGWDAALKECGITGEAGKSGDIAAPLLAGALLEADGGLEDAVAHSSLAAVLQDYDSLKQGDTAQLVTRFLAESIYQRLVLDLGDPLEAATLNYSHWRQGLDGLKSWIAGAGAAADQPPPENWRGLAGWNWVTLVLGKIMVRLLE